MKRKNISLVLGFVLSFSMLFINAPLLMGNGLITGASPAPLSGSSIDEIGVEEGDILYYHYSNVWDNLEDHGDEPGEGVVKIVVTDISISENAIFYDFYRPEMEFDGPSWYWLNMSDDMGDDAQRWLKDDFSNPVFNHSIVFPNNITNMQTENATWDFDTMFMQTFNSSSVSTIYSDATGDWHTVYMETNPDDGAYTFSIRAYINKSTGLMTYYEEINDTETFTLELAGFEMANFVFDSPDSFGVQPDDWIDSFSPEMGNGDTYNEQEKWANYPDWLEPNDNIENACILQNTESVPGKWYELNLHETEDYYKFFVEASIEVEIYIEYYSGADVVLSRIELPIGNVISATLGEQTSEDPMVRESITWTTTSADMYYIKVNGNDGLFDDKYNLGIRFGSNWGPEYWPQGGDDYNKDDNSLWMREQVEFVYNNPYTEEDVIINSQEFYKFPTMASEELEWSNLPKFRARVNSTAPYLGIGEGWFHKDLDFESTEFITWFNSEIDEMWDLQSHTLTQGPGWIQVNGLKINGGDPFFFYAEQLAGLGTVRYINEKYFNSSAERDYSQMNIVIDCSIPGVVTDSHTALGVEEGDSWTYMVQNEWSNNEWGPDNNYNNYQESVIMATFTVTHIFALNHTTMGVVGSREVQMIKNDGSIEPEMHTDSFFPFLVWDTLNPVSFINMGGHGSIDGPPVLLPAGVDWTTQETAMLNLFATMHDGPGTPTAYNFDTNTVRFRFNGRYNDSWAQDGGWISTERKWNQNIVLDVNEFGMTTHLDQSQEERENWHFDGGTTSWDGGREKREKIVAFMVESIKGCDYETDIASITGVQLNDTFVWEKSQYSPAGEWGPDDPGRDPADKSFEKYIIVDVLSACDEFVVFLGAQFYKNSTDTDFHAHEWRLDDGEGGEIVGNYWYLGSIRGDDLWTWMNSNIFDMSITSLAGSEAIIAQMLTYSFAPDAVVTAADIEVDGTSFEVRISAGTIDHVFRFAISAQGIMRDMFMGKYDTTTNTWLNWERTVLVDAPDGYAIGEFFTTDIPDNYVPSDYVDDGGFFGNIPGYSTSVMIFFSLLGIVAITLNKRKS